MEPAPVMPPSVGNKSSLLEQLRIDRETPPNSSGIGWRWWVAGIAALVLLPAGWFLFTAPVGVPVHVAVARAIAATEPGMSAASGGSLLDASGYVVALRQAAVSGKSVYKVVDVLIEAGQHVKKDEVIARLDDTNNHAAQLQAQAQVRSAEATLAAAKTAFADAAPIYARNKKLVAQGWLSHDQFDASQASYDAARMNLAVAEKQLDVARGGLQMADRYEDDTVIRAPFDGVVTLKSAQPGEIVSPQFLGGGGVATIVDMDSLEVQVDVSENFISRVHAGQRAVIKLNAYPDWQIPAHVIAVIPTADQTKATVKVRVAFEQRDDRVLPQMGARVSFYEDGPKAVAGNPAQAMTGVMVPVAAVQGSGDTGAVFVIDGDRVERRAVRLGARTADDQTILSGLQPGAHVALGDLAALSDGARIHVEQ
jgi:RND family efflux transporter MFP subunit